MKKLLTILFLTSLLSSCEQRQKKDEALARKYCSGCHSYVTPWLLDKKTWATGVLPEMSFRMGLDMSKLPGTNATELNEILTALPGSPLVTTEEFESIKNYYITNAPDSLKQVAEANLPALRQFDVSPVTLPVAGGLLLTMVRYDSARKMVFVGTRQGRLFGLTPSLSIADSFSLPGPPSDILLTPGEQPLVASMGIMDPNDLPAGSIVRFSQEGGSHEVIIDSIKRPVHLQQADFNNDRQADLLVSAFGNFTGALKVYEKNGDEYREHVIHHFPGTRKTIVGDFSGDGLPDILALITQGDERVALFTNRGKFKFSYQVLLKFPPVYGSSYFELCDFNGDGHKDILYTNGDNADYSMVLKPYHGVRIFLNDGKNQFSESWFYPMHGASMAHGVDFDQDGDTDIAAISFFPDFENHPEHGFIYLENHQGKFTAFETPLAGSARWITMEAADIDSDNDIDLILGALAFPTGVPDSLYQEWGKQKTSLLILRNNLR